MSKLTTAQEARLHAVHKHADMLKDAAASYAAEVLRAEAYAWEAGLKGLIPASLARIEIDPEYEDYVRLRDKFEPEQK